MRFPFRLLIAGLSVLAPATAASGEPPAGAELQLGSREFRQWRPVTALAFTPDDKAIVSAGEGEICVWDAATGRLLRRLAGCGLQTSVVALTPDGKQLLVGYEGSQVRLWDWATGKELRRFLGPDEVNVPGVRNTYAVAVTADGNRVAALVSSEELRVWDIDAPAPRYVKTVRDGYHGTLAFSPDGTRLAIGTRPPAVLDAATGVPIRGWNPGSETPAPGLAFSPDGKHLFAAGLGAGVSRWDAATGTHVRRYEGDYSGTLAVSDDGKLVGPTHTRAGVFLWRADGEGSVKLTAWSDRHHAPFVQLQAAAFSHDGKRFAAGDGGGVISVWDASTGAEAVATPGSHYGPIRSVLVSPDGKSVATGSTDGAVRLWDAATGRLLREIPGHTDGVQSLSFSANGRLLLSAGGYDRTVRVRETATGKEVFAFRLSVDQPLYDAVPSPDFGVIAVSTAEGAVRLWDVETRRETRRLEGPGRLMFSRLAFTPDGTRLVGVSYEHLACVWDVATGELKHYFAGASRYGLGVELAGEGRLVAALGGETGLRLWQTNHLPPPPAELPATGFAAEWATHARAAEERAVFRVPPSPPTGKGRRAKADATASHFALLPNGRYAVLAGPPSVGPTRLRLVELDTGGECAGFEYPGAVRGVAAVPDDRRVVIAGAGCVALVWDTFRPSADDGLDRAGPAWDRLASPNAAVAFAAMRELVREPEKAVELVRKHVKPADAKLRDWLVEIDDDRPDVSQAATTALERLGRRAEPALGAALAAKVPPQRRDRLKALWAKTTATPPGEPPAQVLRDLRAVELLERVGTEAAREVLASLAVGEPSDRLTIDARVARERLARRPDGAYKKP